MTQEELVIAIRVAAENADQVINDIKESMEELGATVEDVKRTGDGTFDPLKKGADEAAAAQATLAAAAGAAFAAVVKAVNNGTDAYNQYTAATKGLESVASGRGITQDALAKSLDKVTDEFMDASAAATAYKNLLTRGFTLEQATTTIERLKDAATFGRAANLSLSDAVVTATEGLRQENSILVDNAGVTKNVAKMWEEYAKARGLTTASLTQSQKVEAEYLGIIQETQMQVGDLEKASQTLAGTQAENAAVAKELATTYGDAMAPAVQLVTETTTTLMGALKGITSTAPGLVSGLTAAATAMALYVTGTKAAAAAQTLFAAGTSLISGPLAAIAAVVGVVTAAYTAYTKAQDKAAKAQEEAAQAAEQERRAQQQKVTDLSAQAAELEKLAKEYKNLTESQDRSAVQNARLETVISTLVGQYGLSEQALRDLAGEYDTGNDAIADRLTLLKQEILLEKARAELMDKTAQLEQAVSVESQAVGRSQQLGKLVQGMFMMPDFNKQKDDWERSLGEWLIDMRDKFGELDFDEDVFSQLINAQSAEEAKAIMWSYFDTIEAEAISAREQANALREEVELLNQALESPETFDWDKLYSPSDKNSSDTDSSTDTSSVPTGTSSLVQDAEAARSAYAETLDSIVALDTALQNIATLQDESAAAAERHAAAVALQREGYGYLLGDEEAIAAAQTLMLEQATQLSETYDEQREALEAQLVALDNAYSTRAIDEEEYESAYSAIVAQLAQTASGAVTATKSMEKLGKETDDTTDEIKNLTKQTQDLEKRVNDALDFKKQISSMKDLTKEVKESGGGWEALSDEVRDFGKRMGVAEGDLDGLILGLENMEAQSEISVNGLIAELQGIYGELNTLSYELMSIPPAELTADASQLIAEINAAIEVVNLLLSLLGAAGVGMLSSGKSSRRGGGSGGGSGGSSSNYDAAAAARSAERAQEEAYQNELERIEHRRHMGEITAKQELAELERVKREYAKTADQIMDIDERIYDAREELRENESEKITTMYDSIVDALEERYEEQREIEQRRIEDSIAAWEKWSDDTCAAIQKQIDALDEQVEAEDRAAVEAEHLRKIASLEEALIYETDEYDQKQLQKQIVQAKENWAKQQKDWAVEDQREALEEQMQAIEDRADAEIEALEKESERIDSIYDEMVKGQSLAAEAQKLLMESSQEELLNLLSSYAPDYEATGRSLGEKIYAGFQSAFGDITAWFENIDSQFEEMAEKAQQAAFGTTVEMQGSGQTTAQVSSPTINQTVNFNQPVESAADVTRRMQQVSEELAGMV